MIEPTSCRQSALREAEGYLELATLFAEHYSELPFSCERLVYRALDILDRVEERSKPRVDSQRLRGEACRTLKRYDEALGPLLYVTERDSEDLGAWMALGWCYKRLDRIDLAIESLEEALVIDPTEAVLHYNLACYWALMGNVELAVEYLSQALEIDPEYRELVSEETDFDPIRHDAQFQAVASVIV